MRKMLSTLTVSALFVFGAVSAAMAAPPAHIVLEKSRMPMWVLELIVPLVHR
jgi:hypothetical protein